MDAGISQTTLYIPFPGIPFRNMQTHIKTNIAKVFFNCILSSIQLQDAEKLCLFVNVLIYHLDVTTI